MPVKIYFQYHDNLGGFSESWFDPTRSVDINFPAGPIANYLTARLGVSGKQTAWDYVRITDTDPAKKRKVKIFRPTDEDILALNVGVTGSYSQNRQREIENSDFAGTRFLIRKVANDLSQARVFFGGFPDNQCDNGGEYTPTGNFPAAFDKWVLAIVGNGWGWRSYTTPNPSNTAFLSEMVTAPDNTCGITAIPFPGNNDLFQGKVIGTHCVIRISGQVQPKNANGTYTVVVTGPNLCRTVKPLAIVNFVAGNATISLQKDPLPKSLIKAEVIKVVKRGPGRPFGLYRGRSPNRARG